MTASWSFIKWVSEWFDSVWKVGQFVAGVLSVLYVVFGWLPGPRLIMRTLFDGQLLGPFRAFKELLLCLGTLFLVAPTHLVRPRSVRRAVRVWIERAIFDRRPERILPEGKPWQKKWGEAFFKYRGEVSAWKARRRHAVDQLIHGSKPIEISVATCFNVHKAKDKIKRYFETLKKDEADEADHFISPLSIETAYLAPLHLLAGLVSNFPEEWIPVIDDFGRALTHPDDPLCDTELRYVQAFIFDCWLVWGPSIPLCKCDLWTDGNHEALQLGYGDKNNSIPLVSTSPELYKEYSTFLKRRDAMPLGKAARPPAAQVTVVGRPAWGPSVKENRVPPALRGIRDGLMLECIDFSPFGGKDLAKKARLYYSAYLSVPSEGRLNPSAPNELSAYDSCSVH